MLSRNDMFGSVRIDVTKELELQRISNSLEKIKESYVDSKVNTQHPNLSEKDKRLLTQIEGKEGCRVIGSVNMFKMPGEVHFFVDLINSELSRLGLNPNKVRKDIEFSHKLQSVSFGKLADQRIMKRLFGNAIGTQFDKVGDLPAEHSRNSCLYYFISVPNMFSIHKEVIHKETYQYSLVSTCQSAYSFGNIPRIIVAFKTTPLGISYNKEDWSLLQMFISFSAIIGGIYTIMGLLKHTFD